MRIAPPDALPPAPEYPLAPAAETSAPKIPAPPAPDEPTPALPRLGPRLLPLPATAESRSKRLLFSLLALAILLAYAYVLYCFSAPAPGRYGIDENGYLVGGKNLADHFTTGFTPPDPYAFVGAMWLRTPHGRFFPKYPIGVPAIYATLLRVGGSPAKFWAFYVAPAATVLSVAAIFLLSRALAGSFYAVLAMLLLATNHSILLLAHDPASHAADVCFVLWGMFALLFWWRSGRWWTGLIAGFLLGYAMTIRYTEGLLLLPLAVAAVLTIRWRERRTYLRAAVPLLGWLIPVGALLLHNYLTMRAFSGYDATHESSGFTVAEFFRKWEFTAEQLYMFGLFFTAPLGIAGLAMMFRWSWRVALLLTLWLVPALLLYTSYYWGNHLSGVGFLRFFVPLFPPLILAAVWLLRAASEWTLNTGASRRRGSIAVPLAAGLITAISSSVGLMISLPELAREHSFNTNLAYSAHRILEKIPAARGTPLFPASILKHNAPATQPTTPVIFADQGVFPQLLMYMQFVGDADWYEADAFYPKAFGGFAIFGAGARPGDKQQDNPVLLHQARRDFMEQVYKGKTQNDLVREQNAVMARALAAGRPVYAILNPPMVAEFQKFITDDFEWTKIDAWREPAAVPPEPAQSALSPPTFTGGPFFNLYPQVWRIYQIQRRSAPATRPASQPSP